MCIAPISAVEACLENSPLKFLFSAIRQMFVRVSVVLGKRFEHNLAEEGGCMLHCDSLVFAAGASIHPADQVPCVLGRIRQISMLV
jgi:hypothetical protein